ncbi:MAG: hypothetical protein KAJ51_07575 [Thermoplasmata archaeon]|nr:hypothetical protein [Thermoplasmata archaeon]
MIQKSKSNDKDSSKDTPGESGIKGSGTQDNIGNINGTAETSETDISILKKQLEEEITRLQSEFKKQKVREKDMEEERKRLKMETERLSLKRQDLGVQPAPMGGIGIGGMKPVGTSRAGPEVQGVPPQQVAETGDGVSYEIFERLERELKELKNKMNEKADQENVKQLIAQNEELSNINAKFSEVTKLISMTQKELKKVDIKLSEVLEDIGYEESLEITKVPPEILELVYETIIEDVIEKINHDLGAHDTEIAINKTLEEIRFRTSGSELFKFDSGKLKIKNLSKYIRQKSISAKQIHTTFEELLSKLIENVPDYQAKNFAAMIKIKSQELSLDRVMNIGDQFKTIEKNISNLETQLNKLGNNFHESEDTKVMMMTEFRGFNTRVTELAKRLDEVAAKPKPQPTVTKPGKDKEVKAKSKEVKEDKVKPKEAKSKENDVKKPEPPKEKPKKQSDKP